ncbi:MAG: hypothetical protein IJQ80_02420 [Clostridia bacterium]|nr:hypothetical protein [Clostridia bacterium]
MKKVDPFYKSKKWLELRAKALRRDGYTDQLLIREGKRRNATTVHHALPRERYPEYQYCLWNLVSMTDETHEAMHDRRFGTLTKEGELLMQEVADKNGVKLSRLTLVVGLPKSGKTTYVRKHLGGGLCYDLDYIAGAFRLRGPHEERDRASRIMANRMLQAFAVQARRLTGHVYIIRTAPTIEEVEELEPDEIVVCSGEYQEQRADDGTLASAPKWAQIEEIISWANDNGVGVLSPPEGRF